MIKDCSKSTRYLSSYSHEQLVNWSRYDRNGDNSHSKIRLRMAQPSRDIVNSLDQLVNLRCGTRAAMGK